jgi:hypothetical protein
MSASADNSLTSDQRPSLAIVALAAMVRYQLPWWAGARKLACPTLRGRALRLLL